LVKIFIQNSVLGFDRRVEDYGARTCINVKARIILPL